jgi:hypothetical protein
MRKLKELKFTNKNVKKQELLLHSQTPNTVTMHIFPLKRQPAQKGRNRLQQKTENELKNSIQLHHGRKQ